MNTNQKTDKITEIEEIEGFNKSQDFSFGDYPIDNLFIRNENRVIFDVIRRINDGFYILYSEFQRDFIWDEEKQSKLIESILMRIPLPAFYLAENQDGKMIVIDGLQRLLTLKRFLNNELKLKLPHQLELNEKKFEDLSQKLKNRIKDSNLILYIIDAKVPEKIISEIFYRLNK